MKLLYTTFLLILFSLALCAQDKELEDKKRREFEAQKVAFFTQSMKLTPVESGLFWPLYNEMHGSVHKLEKERRNGWKMLSTRKLSVEEISKEMSVLFELERKITETKQHYYTKMLAAIPADKLCKLEVVEMRFHRQLFDKLKKESTLKRK